MFLRSILITVGILVILGGSYFLLIAKPKLTLNPTPTTSPTPTVSLYTCRQDSDCIIVQEGECPCTAGGKATSINKEFKSSWKEQHPPRICPAVMSGDWTCINSVQKCVQDRCQLVR